MATKAKKVSSRRKNADASEVLALLAKEYGPLDRVEFVDLLELSLFAILVERLPLASAIEAFHGFRAEFVDWNEVRISTAMEVQEVLKGAAEPLETALVIKEFLNRLFYEQHQVGLGFLQERNTTEIKSFFKKSPAVSEAIVNLLLAKIREYPALPVSAATFPLAERLGWVDPEATPIKKQKEGFDHIGPDQIYPTFVYFTEHARGVCTADPATMECPSCVLNAACPYPKKSTAKKATKPKAKTVAKSTKASKTKTSAKKTKKKTTKKTSKKS
ncbi:MAG: hypothetical protein KDC38_07815 [Planctomycetes bacterium]|nr:hypothetical protein [Planctomycetota bacterium]